MRAAMLGFTLVLGACKTHYDWRTATFYDPPTSVQRAPPRASATCERFDFTVPAPRPRDAITAIAGRARAAGFAVSKFDGTVHLSNPAVSLVVAPLERHLHVTCCGDVRETCVEEYGRAASTD